MNIYLNDLPFQDKIKEAWNEWKTHMPRYPDIVHWWDQYAKRMKKKLERELKGIQIGRGHAKKGVVAYADDVTIFLTSPAMSESCKKPCLSMSLQRERKTICGNPKHWRSVHGT